MTSKGHAKALVLKPTEKQANMISKGHERALVLKPTEETSRHDSEMARTGARPETNL